ncbi:MAG: D-inositol-3-phosphate glycosyltransferase [Candidatus Nanopelagicales bacterium]|nr:D-inositol-3-phosphate glycosyltransferase [Candidatus Nanopelagicales bacterium]MDD2819067.1 D-inositol-3-phosphate glycosyltransferase [Candidatus Nanopelagicales bacterium]
MMNIREMRSLRPKPKRVALFSIHTSPLDQPGTGDAGGMNVYVLESAKQLAQAGVAVEIFTRATRSDVDPIVEVEPGILVRHVTAGPFEGLRKEDLPGQLCAVTAGVLRAEASRPEGWFDLIHSHYWLSGQVGWLASERWGVPLVHTMHTMAKVKNADLAIGDKPEPMGRVIGEEQVVEAATRLVANTDDEANELINLYGADPSSVDVVHPGVDLSLFAPGDQQAARKRLNVPAHAHVLLFVGRIQPLKAPDVLLHAAAEMVSANPELRSRLLVVIAGGPSGNGLDRPTALVDLANELGIADLVRFEPPTNRHTLADWFRAADLTVVPSYSESFGLVAIESQACGTPVVAASVGGLRTAVNDHVSGRLITGHNPADYASVMNTLLSAPRELEIFRQGSRAHAEQFGWQSTASGLLDSYSQALIDYRTRATSIAL